MPVTPPFRDLAKEYGITIVRDRSDSVMSIACYARQRVDIGICARSPWWPLVRWKIIRLIAVEIDIFCYGPGAHALAQAIHSNEELRLALQLHFEKFFSSLAWSGSTLSTHLSPEVAESDATGGRRFVSNFSRIACKLQEHAESNTGCTSQIEGCGPLFIERIFRFTGYALLLLLFAIVSLF
ncbi:hypothetical protein [Herbaspirillum huttiense]|uniref:hypothetical protein n=1 Tax=Herbaspirillum huttiense TaxID=863372 RepID=UPI0021769D78|nr:hypothetical protein [Herbaspirillum huttiense]UWE18074.1 hypothetical protein NY669_07840 [Herbaspirillum huttiense]